MLSKICFDLIKTPIEKKTASYLNQTAPLPNLGNLPQVGNQWPM